MAEINPNNVNQVEAPIELAMKIFQEQQDRVFNSIGGVQTQQRREMVAGIPLDDILPSVLDAMEQENAAPNT
jgi:hypothetical protein